MLRKVVLTAVLVALTASVALGQDGTNSQASSGSIYSKLGLGFPVSIASTANGSAGLLGVSFNQSNVGNLANPAHWGSTVYGLGSGGLAVHSFNVSDGNSSVTNSEFTIEQFQLQLPIIRGKLGISGSFSPLTRSNFKTFQQTTRLIERGTSQDTLTYTIENTGSGGLNRAELGIGWRINNNFMVGYAASAVLLSQDDKYSSSFNNLTYRQVSYTYETSGVGMGNRFGAYAQFPGLFRENDQLGFGATVNLPVTIDASQQKTSGQVIQTVDPVDLGEGTVTLPAKISGGISYSPSNMVLVAAEGLYQGWSNYSNDFDAAAQQTGAEFVDRYKVGLGMQYFPYLTGSDKFLSTFKYRLGATYDTGHISIGSEKINTLMFSFGLGIRSPNSNSSIDLSFEYGIRGTNAMDLVKEQIWGINLSLNLAEIMFFRPKLQ